MKKGAMTQSDTTPIGPNGSAENLVKALRAHPMAHDLTVAIAALYNDPTPNNMVRLNMLWARAHWILERVRSKRAS